MRKRLIRLDHDFYPATGLHVITSLDVLGLCVVETDALAADREARALAAIAGRGVRLMPGLTSTDIEGRL